MNNNLTTYITQTFLFVIIQVLILNEILFFTYINPFLYIILIITLPLSIPKWILLFYAFFIGCTIDLFSDSLGFHSTALVFMAFMKPLISKLTIPHNILSETDKITLDKIGPKSFITFTSILTIIHHLLLFIITHLDLNFNIILKSIASVIVTLILIIITQLFEKRK